MFLVSALAAAALLAGAEPASTSATVATSTDVGGAAAAPVAKPKKVCKTFQMTGSRHPKRVCTTNGSEPQNPNDTLKGPENVGARGNVNAGSR